MTYHIKRTAMTAIALSLSLVLGACSSNSQTANSTLNSVNQPVVTRANYTLDLMASSSGLTVPEQARLAEWFEAMDVGYGDRISIDDPLASDAVREDVGAIAGRFGLLLNNGAPVTVGYVDPGSVRVVVTRSTASVPNCPNWNGHANSNLGNNTSPGFGCSVNGNMAAMIADPEHLLNGAEATGDSLLVSTNKAVDVYRAATPPGAGGLPAVSSQGS